MIDVFQKRIRFSIFTTYMLVSIYWKVLFECGIFTIPWITDIQEMARSNSCIEQGSPYLSMC